MISDRMQVYQRYLAAHELSEMLMMRYAQMASRGTRAIHEDSEIDAAFEKLADRLGYHVSRVIPEVSPTRSYVMEAAE